MKPETVGMSSARLTRLDHVMKGRYVDGGYLPGMLTYVWRKDHLVHTGLCGQMDIARGKPMLTFASHPSTWELPAVGVASLGARSAGGPALSTTSFIKLRSNRRRFRLLHRR